MLVPERQIRNGEARWSSLTGLRPERGDFPSSEWGQTWVAWLRMRSWKSTRIRAHGLHPADFESRRPVARLAQRLHLDPKVSPRNSGACSSAARFPPHKKPRFHMKSRFLLTSPPVFFEMSLPAFQTSQRRTHFSREASGSEAARNEFLGDVALEAGGHDGLASSPGSAVPGFRRFRAGRARRRCGSGRCTGGCPGWWDHVPFHDLHVVDVVEQLESLRADALAKLHAPGGMVAHVISVVHLAVEQLHADGDLVFSASAMNRFKPAAQFSRPCSSPMPWRLPEKQIRLGQPASATREASSGRTRRFGRGFPGG